jgi:hypothetical protein
MMNLCISVLMFIYLLVFIIKLGYKQKYTVVNVHNYISP